MGAARGTAGAATPFVVCNQLSIAMVA